jgi:hypothetical protein
MPVLADPLVVCRETLLDDPLVQQFTDGRVYATPVLPPDHQYPCIRLSHTGGSGHAPVPFRHSYVAGVQLDVWAYDQTVCALIGEAALDILHRVPTVEGAVSIRPTFEARELDESVQPALHRYRADLEVRVRTIEIAQPKLEV